MKPTKSQQIKDHIKAQAQEVLRKYPRASKNEQAKILAGQIRPDHYAHIVYNYASRALWEASKEPRE